MCVPCSQILKSSFHCPGAGHGCPSPVVLMLSSTPQGCAALSGLLPCCRAPRKLSPEVTLSSWISPSKIREINLSSIWITVGVFYYCTRKLRNHNVLGAIQRLTVHSYEASPLPFLLTLSPLFLSPGPGLSSIFPSGMPPSQSLVFFSLYQHREPVSNTVPRKRNYKRKLAGRANKQLILSSI